MAPNANSSLRRSCSSAAPAGGVTGVAEAAAMAVADVEGDGIVAAGGDDVAQGLSVAQFEAGVRDVVGRE
ncbi:hypothetical protein EBT31_19580, partial [bacterium]|nr:hypothetical protein [bacterium]